MRAVFGRHVVIAVVVLAVQFMATLMTLRREPLVRFEGTVISSVLWWATRPPEQARPD